MIDDLDTRGWRASPGQAPGLSKGKIALVAAASVVVIAAYLLMPLEGFLPSFFGSSEPPAQQAPVVGGTPELKELNGLQPHYTAKPPAAPPIMAVAEATPDTSLLDALKRQYDEKYAALQGEYDAINKRLTDALGLSQEKTAPTPPVPEKKATRIKTVDPEAQKRADAKKQRREAMLSSPTGFSGRPKEDQPGQLHALKSPYSLAPGEEIPCETTMTISSETPGAFVVVVSQDVPDTATRSKNVIPKLSRMVVKPRRSTIMGDNRIDVESKTLTFPSGPWLKMPAGTMTDRYGTAGFSGEVDRHYLRNYGAVILTGVLRGGSTIVAGGYGGSTADRVTGTVAQDTASEATRDVRQFIRTDPTITINKRTKDSDHPVYACKYLLEDELVLTRAYPWTP